ncbi:hypothetical protein GGI05_001365, partial [Coemansia sp. RSA 2603]
MCYVHTNYGHPKGTAFVAELRRNYWFDGMVRACMDFTRHCHTCQLATTTSETQAGVGICEPDGIGQHIYLDHGYIGDPREPSCKQFLVMVDQESGFVAAAAARGRNTKEVFSALHNHWIRPYGPPLKVTVDGAR